MKLRKLKEVVDKRDKRVLADNKRIKQENIQIKQINITALHAEVDEAIVLFTRKHGYKPKLLYVRADECNGIEFPIPAVIGNHGVTPSHFMLGPVVNRRNPRLLNKERKSCLM